MTSTPHTPVNGAYGSSVPAPQQSHLERGYGLPNHSQSHLASTTGELDFAQTSSGMAAPTAASSDPPGSVPIKDEIHPFSHPQHESHQHHHHDTAAIAEDGAVAGGVNRSASSASTAYNRDTAPSRSGTLKKKSSVMRKSSLRRSGSRKSMTGGSIKSVGFAGGVDGEEYNSAFYTPVPTHGSPTEVLANRFQGMFDVLHSSCSFLAASSQLDNDNH